MRGSDVDVKNMCNKMIKREITSALGLLLNFCTIGYFVLHKIFLRVWVVNYFSPHHILLLCTVS